MTFDALRESFDGLRRSVAKETGHEFFDEITVPEPGDERTELDFLNLVTWCYVLIFEAGTTLLRHLGALARANDPQISTEYMRVRSDVQNIRTSRFHNLPNTSKTNERKLQQANIWLQSHGGHPVDWRECCHALCHQMVDYIQLLNSHWVAAIATDEDKEQIVRQLVTALQKKWSAHDYDRIVEEITDELQIEGLDIVAYRGDKLNDWQRITSYFSDREAAETAIRATIHNGLVDTFRPRTII